MIKLKKSLSDDKKAIIQYKYIKELSLLKWDEEERREQSLIKQSSQMQTIFSFMSVAIFMCVTICIDNRGTIPITFFIIAVSFILFFLVVSLILASFVQWRYKTTTMPSIETIRKSIIDSDEWEKFTDENNQYVQFIDYLSNLQNAKEKLNDRRVKMICVSLIFFYLSIVAIFASYAIIISKIVLG